MPSTWADGRYPILEMGDDGGPASSGRLALPCLECTKQRWMCRFLLRQKAHFHPRAANRLASYMSFIHHLILVLLLLRRIGATKTPSRICLDEAICSNGMGFHLLISRAVELIRLLTEAKH
ncbi:hypothetical protein Trco_005918 [Trichoderma cornu-damae]|uniref:Uncharacterized protein n=1 Tax=Trichoderma cornu-damae TaxID=654480 RepID=A0A9P8QNU7_9HYPO|nr:hypothetical protein Trco_005918 [Trichoderma cornu-damae]